EVVLDDRGLRPGSMFADIELVGIPHRVVVSGRGLEAGTFEYRHRSAAEPANLDRAAVLARLGVYGHTRQRAAAPPGVTPGRVLHFPPRSRLSHLLRRRHPINMAGAAAVAGLFPTEPICRSISTPCPRESSRPSSTRPRSARPPWPSASRSPRCVASWSSRPRPRATRSRSCSAPPAPPPRAAPAA